MNPANRTETGKFKKGFSGNPSGRPKTPDELKEIFAELTTIGVQKIRDILDDVDVPAQVKLNTVKEIFDRHLGKPTQQIESNSKIDIKDNRTEEEKSAQLELYKKMIIEDEINKNCK